MLEIESGINKLSIDPVHGGRATSWKVKGVELLSPAGENPIIGGFYLMAPWVGRLRDSEVVFNGQHFPQQINFQDWAIHGTFPFSDCELVFKTDTEIVLKQKTTKDWPISAIIECRWLVLESGIQTTATISTEIGKFPASLGWHPWFRRKLEVGLPAIYEIESQAIFNRGKELIIDGSQSEIFSGPFDDSFLVPSGKSFISWPHFCSIEIESTTKFFHLYEAQNSVCIEPETSPPNGINLMEKNLGFLVTPDSPLTATVDWKVNLSEI